jgi:hypothetical protein
LPTRMIQHSSADPCSGKAAIRRPRSRGAPEGGTDQRTSKRGAVWAGQPGQFILTKV